MSFSVKTINNEIIKLEAKAFASGGEGLIHKVISPSKYKNCCVKIYKDSIPTRNRNHQAIKDRERKITYMVKNPPSKLNASQWLLAWPKDVVYETNGNFLGFIMLLAFNKSVELFQLTNIKISSKLSSEWNKFDRSSGDGIKRRLMLNANIAIAVHHLHASKKYVIVDMKPQNFLVSPEGKVTVLDIDTIQISNNGSVMYPSKAMTAEYLPPESKNLTKNSSIPTDWDRFILGIIFYEVLFGVHPFAGTVFNPPYDNYATLQDKISNGLFPYGSLSPYVKNINAKGHLFLQRLPISIQDLFLDTFDKGLYKSDRRPSADAWGQTIYTVLKQQENINNQQSQIIHKQREIDWQNCNKSSIPSLSEFRKKYNNNGKYTQEALQLINRLQVRGRQRNNNKKQYTDTQSNKLINNKEKAKVNPLNWYLVVLKNYNGFSGRARRKEYWMFVLFNMIFGFVAIILDNILGIAIDETGYGPLYGIYVLVVLMPGSAVTVRRLHDVGKSGWMFFIILIPLIGYIWLFVLLVTDSDPRANKYGANPKWVSQQGIAF